MRQFWEVRHNGVRYCHCGTLEDATRVAAMSPLRTIHKLPTTAVEVETVDIAAVSLGHERSLNPQLVLPESELIKLDL